MVGGKDHTTHHLVYAGLRDIQVWYVFVSISAIAFLLSSLMVYFAKIHALYSVIFCAVYFLVVFTALFRLTRKYAQK